MLIYRQLVTIGAVGSILVMQPLLEVAVDVAVEVRSRVLVLEEVALQILVLEEVTIALPTEILIPVTTKTIQATALVAVL